MEVEHVWGGLLVMVLLLVARIFVVLSNTGRTMSPSPAQHRPLRTLIVLGSGGHTAEMMSLVGALNLQRYAPRFYIAAATDNMSLAKAQRAEAQIIQESPASEMRLSGDYFPTEASTLLLWQECQGIQAGAQLHQKPQYSQIYRSREVGQSYVTSVFTTIWAFAHSLWRVLCIQPDVILCNGPGTCLPICVASFLLKVVGIRWVVIVYVESIARVKKLSLTGLILYKLGLSDQLFVQWPQLKSKFPRTSYVGRLM